MCSAYVVMGWRKPLPWDIIISEKEFLKSLGTHSFSFSELHFSCFHGGFPCENKKWMAESMNVAIFH